MLEKDLSRPNQPLPRVIEIIISETVTRLNIVIGMRPFDAIKTVHGRINNTVRSDGERKDTARRTSNGGNFSEKRNLKSLAGIS